MKRRITTSICTLLLGLAVAQPASAAAKVTKLLSRPVAEQPGKEAVLIMVEYAAGDFTPKHRHDAYVEVFVLEGKVTMQLDGEEARTLGPGDTFYEEPDDIHLVSKNASDTAPAKFVAWLLKDVAKPIVILLD